MIPQMELRHPNADILLMTGKNQAFQVQGGSILLKIFRKKRQQYGMRSTKPRMTFTKHFFLFTFEISKASMLLSIEDVWVKTKENSYPVYILTRFLYCLYVENLNTCRWICNPFLEFSLIFRSIFFGGEHFFVWSLHLPYLKIFFRVNSTIQAKY